MHRLEQATGGRVGGRGHMVAVMVAETKPPALLRFPGDDLMDQAGSGQSSGCVGKFF